MRVPRIDIRTCDDWVAVYKDGVRVWDNHSCPLRDGLEALGIPFVERDFHDEMDYDLGVLKNGEDAFPEKLP